MPQSLSPSPYNQEFFDAQSQDSYISAQHVLALFNRIFSPQSVIDVGCGIGTWLKAWQEINPHAFVFGVDGNQIASQHFYIDQSHYKMLDLTLPSQQLLSQIPPPSESNKNLEKSKPYALCQSLEVAEHLEEKYAYNFVHLLTSLSNVVLFSAALPYQGGTHHVNEQLPQFWQHLFQEHHFHCFDFLRAQILNQRQICPWYRQNIFVFVHQSQCAFFENQGFFKTNTPPWIVLMPHIQQHFLSQEKELKELKLFQQKIIHHPVFRFRQFIKQNFNKFFK